MAPLLIYELDQEATIGVLLMCATTLLTEFVVRSFYSWEENEFQTRHICTQQQNRTSDERIAPVVCAIVMMVATGPLILGFKMFYDSDTTARNMGLIYGLGAANASLIIYLIWPGVDERLSFAIKTLPTYIGLLMGNLQ